MSQTAHDFAIDPNDAATNGEAAAQQIPSADTTALPFNSMAVISMVSALAGLLIFPVVGSLVAIITGHVALKQLKTTPGQGEALAFAGLITGYISVALAGLITVIMVGFFALLVPLIYFSAGI